MTRSSILQEELVARNLSGKSHTKPEGANRVGIHPNVPARVADRAGVDCCVHALRLFDNRFDQLLYRNRLGTDVSAMIP